MHLSRWGLTADSEAEQVTGADHVAIVNLPVHIMAQCPRTAQPMKLSVEEATAVGRTFSQQQLPPQQHVVQVSKSGQHHLSQ